MSEETWRAIPGWEGLYEASDQGSIRSLGSVSRAGRRQGRVLKPRLRQGRYQVTLSRGSSKTTMLVHRAVLAAFVGPKPDGLVGCHNDGDALNNRLENLRYDTVAANAQDSLLHGTNPHASKTHCPAGHEYSDENTWRSKVGHRLCKTCTRERVAAIKSRKMSAA